jgi:hypothetical protein
VDQGFILRSIVGGLVVDLKDILELFSLRRDEQYALLTVYFGAPSMFITLWFGFDYGTNPPLGTLFI